MMKKQVKDTYYPRLTLELCLDLLQRIKRIYMIIVINNTST